MTDDLPPRSGGTTCGDGTGVGDPLRFIVAGLKRFYGPLQPPPRDPFALYVWEILSSRTTPSRRDAAFAALRRIPALTPDAVKRAPRAKLEAAVALAGALSDQRLEAMLRAAESLRRAPDLRDRLRGSMLGVRRALRELPQVGDGWAQRMLMGLAPRAIVPRDAGVARVLNRVGLLGQSPDVEEDARAVEVLPVSVTRSAARALGMAFSPSADLLRDAFFHIAHHATVSCTALEPHCQACPLAEGCVYYAKRRRNSSVSTLR